MGTTFSENRSKKKDRLIDLLLNDRDRGLAPKQGPEVTSFIQKYTPLEDDEELYNSLKKLPEIMDKVGKDIFKKQIEKEERLNNQTVKTNVKAPSSTEMTEKQKQELVPGKEDLQKQIKKTEEFGKDLVERKSRIKIHEPEKKDTLTSKEPFSKSNVPVVKPHDEPMIEDPEIDQFRKEHPDVYNDIKADLTWDKVTPIMKSALPVAVGGIRGLTLGISDPIMKALVDKEFYDGYKKHSSKTLEFIGDFTGGVITGRAILKGLSKLKSIDKIKNVAVKMGLLRGMVGGTTSGGRNLVSYLKGDQSLEEALKNTGISAGATMFSMIPENYVKPGIINLVSQVGGDMSFEIIADLVLGRFENSPEYWKQKGLNSIPSAVFGMVDFMNPDFKLQQKAFKQGISDIKNKTGNVLKNQIQLVNQALDGVKLKFQESQAVGITPFKKGIDIGKGSNKSIKNLYNNMVKAVEGKRFLRKSEPQQFTDRSLAANDVEKIIENKELSIDDKVDKIKRALRDNTKLVGKTGYGLLKLHTQPQLAMDINSGGILNSIGERFGDAVIKRLGGIVLESADQKNKIGVHGGGDEFGIINGTKQDALEINDKLKKITFVQKDITPKRIELFKRIYARQKAEKLGTIGVKEGELFDFKIAKQKNGRYTIEIKGLSLSGGAGGNKGRADYLLQLAKQKKLDGAALDKNDLDKAKIKDYINIKGGEEDVITKKSYEVDRRKGGTDDTVRSGTSGDREDIQLQPKDNDHKLFGRYTEDYTLSVRDTKELEKDFQSRLKTFSFLEKDDPKKWIDIISEDTPAEKFVSAMRKNTDGVTSHTFLNREVYLKNNFNKKPQLLLDNSGIGIVNKIFGERAGDDIIKETAFEIKQTIGNALAKKGMADEDIDLLFYKLIGGNFSVIDLKKHFSIPEIKKLVAEVNDRASKIWITPKNQVKETKANSALFRTLRKKGLSYKEGRITGFSVKGQWLGKGQTEKVDIQRMEQKLKGEKLTPQERLMDMLGSEGYKDFTRRQAPVLPILRNIIKTEGDLPKDIVFKQEDEQYAEAFKQIEKDKREAYEYTRKHIPTDDYDNMVKETEAGGDDPLGFFVQFKNKLNDVADAILETGEGSYFIPDLQKNLAVDWIGAKQTQEYRARMIAVNMQKATAKALGETAKSAAFVRYEKKGEPYMTTRAKAHDMAMQLLLDAGSKDNLRVEYEKYKDRLPKAYHSLTKLALNLPDELSNIQKVYQRMYQMAGKYGQDTGILRELKENFAARYWEGKSYIEAPVGGFKKSTKHAKRRVYGSILEGLANGEKLQVKGASNSLMYYMQDIYNVIQDRAFIKLGSELVINDQDHRLFETKPPNKDYVLVNHPAFKKFEYKGKVGGVRDINTGKILTKPQLMDQDFIVMGNGTVLKARQVYAPKKIAGYLNNILGKSAIKDIPVLKQILELNRTIKQTILTTSLFHPRALTQSYLLGGHVGWKNLNPIKGYRTGLKMAESMDPLIQLGVQNSLTLDYTPGFLESALPQTYKTGFKGLIHKWNRSIFERYAAGLKAMAFKHEFERQLKIYDKGLTKSVKKTSVKGLDKYNKGIRDIPEFMNEIAYKAAKLINDDFGGLNLTRMGRNKTLQDIFRMTLLASDWTESNLRSAVKATPFRKNKDTGKIEWAYRDAEPYVKFWTRIFAKSIITANLINYAINGQSTFQNKDKDKMLDIDVTKLIDPTGKNKKRYYFSIIGHFRDPSKMVVNPAQFIKHKSSPAVQRGIDLLTGRDWAERPFTGVKELIKTGKQTKKSIYNKKEEVFWDTLPSYVVNSVMSSLPIHVQSLKGFIDGHLMGIEALLRSAGLPLEVRYKKPEKSIYGDAYSDPYKDVYKDPYKDPYKKGGK